MDRIMLIVCIASLALAIILHILGVFYDKNERRASEINSSDPDEALDAIIEHRINITNYVSCLIGNILKVELTDKDIAYHYLGFNRNMLTIGIGLYVFRVYFIWDKNYIKLDVKYNGTFKYHFSKKFKVVDGYIDFSKMENLIYNKDEAHFAKLPYEHKLEECVRCCRKTAEKGNTGPQELFDAWCDLLTILEKNPKNERIRKICNDVGAFIYLNYRDELEDYLEQCSEKESSGN